VRQSRALSIGAVVAIAVGLLSGCGKPTAASLTLSSTCADYLALDAQDRSDAAMRLSIQAKVQDAGNPMFGATMDTVCGARQATTTMLEAFTNSGWANGAGASASAAAASAAGMSQESVAPTPTSATTMDCSQLLGAVQFAYGNLTADPGYAPEAGSHAGYVSSTGCAFGSTANRDEVTATLICYDSDANAVDSVNAADRTAVTEHLSDGLVTPMAARPGGFGDGMELVRHSCVGQVLTKKGDINAMTGLVLIAFRSPGLQA
jgi:hypothetical protein